MVKRIMLALAMLLGINAVLDARPPRLSYGLEWGYTATMLKTAQHNFICAEGYRIIENPQTWWYYSNGSILADAGLDIGQHFNLSAYSGIIGVYSKRWMIPAELRLRYCPAGLHSDGFIFQAGGGALFPTATLRETGIRGLIGGGYRLAVYRDISVDLLLSMHLSVDHERIVDPDTGNYVPRMQIAANTAEYYALNISVAINF